MCVCLYVSLSKQLRVCVIEDGGEEWSCLVLTVGFNVASDDSEINQKKFFSSFDFLNYNGTLLQYSCLENPMDGGAW